MLRNILLVLLVLTALVVSIVPFLRDEEAVTRAASQPWPGGVGALDSIGDRFPKRSGNEASRRLEALGEALPTNEASDDYVRRELTSSALSIGEPPKLADVTALRELLLLAPIEWESHAEFDAPEVATRRVLWLKIARAFIASALSRAGAGESIAWEDLRAVWNLARSFDDQPQMMAQTAALTMERMLNAAAWKLPLPAPEWFREVTAHDPIPGLLGAFQYSAASYVESGSQLLPTPWLAKSIDHDRGIAEELAQSNRCDVTARENEFGPSLVSVWRRAFRYRAEREATDRALRVRAGQPIDARSAYSEGGWILEGNTLRFRLEIPVSVDELPVPLELRIGP